MHNSWWVVGVAAVFLGGCPCPAEGPRLVNTTDAYSGRAEGRPPSDLRRRPDYRTGGGAALPQSADRAEGVNGPVRHQAAGHGPALAQDRRGWAAVGLDPRHRLIEALVEGPEVAAIIAQARTPKREMT